MSPPLEETCASRNKIPHSVTKLLALLSGAKADVQFRKLA